MRNMIALYRAHAVVMGRLLRLDMKNSPAVAEVCADRYLWNDRLHPANRHRPEFISTIESTRMQDYVHWPRRLGMVQCHLQNEAACPLQYSYSLIHHRHHHGYSQDILQKCCQSTR